MLNRFRSVEVDAFEHQILPPSAQAEDCFSAIVALVHASRITDDAGHQPVGGHDPGGDRDADAEDGTDQVDEDKHARVEDTVFVGVGWEWRVNRLELEVEGGTKQRGELLAKSDSSCAQSHGL